MCLQFLVQKNNVAEALGCTLYILSLRYGTVDFEEIVDELLAAKLVGYAHQVLIRLHLLLLLARLVVLEFLRKLHVFDLFQLLRVCACLIYFALTCESSRESIHKFGACRLITQIVDQTQRFRR